MLFKVSDHRAHRFSAIEAALSAVQVFSSKRGRRNVIVYVSAGLSRGSESPQEMDNMRTDVYISSFPPQVTQDSILNLEFFVWVGAVQIEAMEDLFDPLSVTNAALNEEFCWL